jgi:hypothetical protein
MINRFLALHLKVQSQTFSNSSFQNENIFEVDEIVIVKAVKVIVKQHHETQKKQVYHIENQ